MYYFDKKLMNIYTFFYLIKLLAAKTDIDKIYKKQNRKLKKLMKRAYQIPVYRKKFEECGLLPKDFKSAEDLTKFPVLTKQELREWIEPEVDKTPEKYKNCIKQRTSGSSGTPTMTCLTPKENAMVNANWLRILMRNGLHPLKDVTLAIRGVVVKSDGGVQKLGVFRRKTIHYKLDGEQIYNEYMDYKPDCFYAHKSKIIEMILYAEKNNLPLHKPKMYASISELLDNVSKEKMIEFLGGGLFNSYGSMETGACTYTLKGNPEKHYITNDTHIVNVIDEKGNLSDNGKIVITNLFLKKFPIINYDIQDGAEGFTENNIRYIKYINGRMNDWIKTANGNVYNFSTLGGLLRYHKEILQFRIEQFSLDDIRMYLVKDRKYGSVPEEEIEKRIIDDIKSTLADESLDFSVEWKDELPPDANGKRRIIINHMN